MRRMQERHLTIQLTTFRRHETTVDVTMMNKEDDNEDEEAGEGPDMLQ
jgi:hypothetical protein